MEDNDWSIVGSRKKRGQLSEPPLVQGPPGFSQYDLNPDTKISEPCWFYNNGGCRNKDGTEKLADDCKYLHCRADNVQRPAHLCNRRPCDKYNLEGECKWSENCKYSHRNLSPEEWSRYYPGIPYTLRTNVQKRLEIEDKLQKLEAQLKIMEFKQDGISKDVQQIGQRLHNCIRQLQHFSVE
jgi:hypothetical protein